MIKKKIYQIQAKLVFCFALLFFTAPGKYLGVVFGKPFFAKYLTEKVDKNVNLKIKH